MAPDDLNTPLGQEKAKATVKAPVSAPQMLAGLLGLSGLMVVAWAAFVNDPLGGEPVAVVATKIGAFSPAERDGAGRRQNARTTWLPSGDQAPEAAKQQPLPPPGSQDNHHH